MNDPVKHCNLYKEIGCSHLDGMMCDFPKCSMLTNYVKNVDEKALDTATEIMALLPSELTNPQIKAKIQCVIIDLLEDGK